MDLRDLGSGQKTAHGPEDKALEESCQMSIQALPPVCPQASSTGTHTPMKRIVLVEGTSNVDSMVTGPPECLLAPSRATCPSLLHGNSGVSYTGCGIGGGWGTSGGHRHRWKKVLDQSDRRCCGQGSPQTMESSK